MSLIGNRIKLQRKKMKLTQPQLAEKIGVSLDMVKSMETHRSNPSIETLNKLADTFGCSVDYLLGRDNLKLLELERTVTEQLIHLVKTEMEKLGLEPPEPTDLKLKLEEINEQIEKLKRENPKE